MFANETMNFNSQLRPLAARMRPSNIDEYVGQEHLLAIGKPLREALQAGHLHSMILWGPPGTGKTTLAQLLAQQANAHMETISAVMAGVKDVRAIVARAQLLREQESRATILFVDEVHRFNKSQQDAFLPFVEDGVVTLIGATTENPSFELNNALLSRARVYLLKSLTDEHILQILNNAIADKARGLGDLNVHCSDNTLLELAKIADGDGRRALNLLEIATDLAHHSHDKLVIDTAVLEQVVSTDVRRFDKGGDIFYDQISALHKAVRGSSPNAALYWFARMVDGGCDPLYIARRVVRMANEDIGNADPRGLQIALNAWDVQQRLGSPEGELAIAQALVYLACAPKSNAVYKAYAKALQSVKDYGSLPVPNHLRNAPTRLMKNLGYGHNYRYAHDEPEAYAPGVHYFPDTMPEQHYYEPTARGLEGKIAEKLRHLQQLEQDYKDKHS